MKESVLVLTPFLKLRKSFIPIILILACLTFQFFFIKFHYNNALSQPKDNITENVKEVTAVVSGPESVINDKKYQSLKIGDESLVFDVEKTYSINDNVSVWAYDLTVGEDKISEQEGTLSGNIFYSLTEFSVETGKSIDALALTVLFLVTVLNFALIHVLKTSLVYLKANSFVSDMRLAYNKKYFSLKTVNSFEIGPALAYVLLTVSTLALTTFPAACVSHFYLSGNVISLSGYAFITLGALGLGLFGSLPSVLLQEQGQLAKLVVKYCWVGNFTKVPVNEIPLHDIYVKEKFVSWAKTNNVDFEVAKALAPTFGGTLKELKSVAKVLGPDAK